MKHGPGVGIQVLDGPTRLRFPGHRTMLQNEKGHLTEYAIEAAALGVFMLSAAFFTVLLEFPASPVRQAITDGVARRALTGIAMGLTLVGIVYSRPGRRSGAHMNPVLTLTFFRLGKISARDTLGYVAAQFAGAVLVMGALAGVGRHWLEHPAVNYVQTVPGAAGVAAAFLAETVISFGMMLLVLGVSNSTWRTFTGAAAGVLVAIYIAIEAPLSGMSMNPARSAGPALVAGNLGVLWIYAIAPAFGMLTAAEVFVRARGLHAVVCAKLHHDSYSPCIFRCGYMPGRPTAKGAERSERGAYAAL